MKKDKNELYIGICIIVGIFICSPLLLRIPCVRELFSWFLQPLGDSDYKSSYIETFGAILGTFLAVAGALWTQRKIDEAAAQKEVKESALIVYYDFEFAFNDIITFVNAYLASQKKITNVIEAFDDYRKYKKRQCIYIDDDCF